MTKTHKEAKFLKYTVTQDSVSSDRKILVINGIPFYSSTGTSEDKDQLIDPSWRTNLWMPIVGVDTESGKEGHLSKLGSHIKGINIFRAIVEDVYDALPQETKEGILSSLMLEKYINDPTLGIDANMVLTDLAKQLCRFGTVEAMVISMHITPEEWERNAFLKNVKTYVCTRYPIPAISPSLIPQTCDVTISVNMDLPESAASIEKKARKINEWLLTEIRKEHSPAVSMQIATGTLSIGIGCGVAGSLILAGILNVGLLSGVGGIVLAGLTTAAACTGFGLIFAAVVLIGVGCYLLKNQEPKTNDDKAATRAVINTFLEANASPQNVSTISYDGQFFGKSSSGESINPDAALASEKSLN